MSSKGQIAIPKAVRDALNLSEGAKLTLQVRGQEIVLSREPAWKKLQGSVRDSDLTAALSEERKWEREHDDSRS